MEFSRFFFRCRVLDAATYVPRLFLVFLASYLHSYSRLFLVAADGGGRPGSPGPKILGGFVLGYLGMCGTVFSLGTRGAWAGSRGPRSRSLKGRFGRFLCADRSLFSAICFGTWGCQIFSTYVFPEDFSLPKGPPWGGPDAVWELFSSSKWFFFGPADLTYDPSEIASCDRSLIWTTFNISGFKTALNTQFTFFSVPAYFPNLGFTTCSVFFFSNH